MHDALDIDALAAIFYEAVLEPPKWKEGLQALVQFAGARGASLSLADLSVPTNTLIDTVGQSPEAIRAYASYYVEFDPLLRLGERLPPGRWVSDWAVLGKSYGKTAYYNDFMRVHDRHAVLVASLWQEGTSAALIALHRSKSQGEFPAEPHPALVQLMPHLQRAAKLHFTTQQLQAQADFATATLHRMTTPVMVVEAGGRVLLANAAAEQLTRSSKLLHLRHHRLVAKFQDPPLQQAIRDAATAGRARPSWLRLAATAGEPALLLVVSPMSATSPHVRTWQRPLAVVMASRQSADARRVDSVLMDLFGLTAAESRVATAVAEGLSPAEIAERDKVVVQTVRGQLKGVYSKMGIRRQAELSRLVTKLQGILPRERD